MLIPYTATADLCNFCAGNKTILPCLEAFEMGLEIPGIYCIFYEFFFKASAGDSRWKATCLNAKTETDRLGSRLGEAFAILVLKNNYFAWLLEAKEQLQGKLVTDYDTDTQRKGFRNVVEGFLQLDFKLPEDTTTDPTDESGTEITTAAIESCIVKKDDSLYEGIKKRTETALKSARRTAKNNAKYKEINKRLIELQNEAEEFAAAGAAAGQDGGEDADDDAGVLSAIEEERKANGERQRKRRKLLKSFREYTVRKSDEGKFKGWSKRAAEEMTGICKKLKLEGEGKRAKMFSASYRVVNRQRNVERRRDDAEENEPVDYSELWDLDEVEMAAV